MRSAAAAASTTVPSSVRAAVATAGRPLAPEVERSMRAGLGHELRQVRADDDATAHASARDLAATEYTIGRHVVLGGAVEERPRTAGGWNVLTHEPVRTVQQADTPHAEPVRASEPDAVECEADAVVAHGRPLLASTRAFMEPRFGHDFSRVRVHTGPAAVRATTALHARAFTIGHDIVVSENDYAPETAAGRWLIAHELAHVVQQDGRPPNPQARLDVSTPREPAELEADIAADLVLSGLWAPRLMATPSRVQRTCGPALGDPAPDCALSAASVIGWQFAFIVDCDQFQPGEAARLTAFAHGLRPGTDLKVHGFASEEGPAPFNLSLSCHRANVVATMLRTARPDCTVSAVFKHGPHGGAPGREFWRSVIVEGPRPEPPLMCGPDATDWLIDQVARAKTDRVVLEIQANLASARRVAASYGFSAEDVTEGGVAKKVLAEETRQGSPTRSADATAQIVGSRTGQIAFGRAVNAAVFPIAGAPEQIVLLAIRRASLAWKALVGTGMRYDFKNDSSTMRRPTSASCPAGCANTITLSPSTGSDCFGTDVPGNLFYAHIGRFVGFTELALQLGSQFAQLESSATWDPPEDTAMIHAGFLLPDPLDRAGLAAAMASLRSSITQHACANCSEPTTAILK